MQNLVLPFYDNADMDNCVKKYPCPDLEYKGKVVMLSAGAIHSLGISRGNNESNGYKGIIENIEESLNDLGPLVQANILGPICLVEICERYFPGKFYDYARKVAAGFTARREQISYRNLQKAIFTKCINASDVKRELDKIVLEEETTQKKVFPLSCKFDVSQVVWKHYWLKGENLNLKTYDFRKIINPVFRKCTIIYANHQIKTKKVKPTALNIYTTLVPALNYFTEKFPEATDLSTITQPMVRSFLHHFEFEYEHRNKSSKKADKKGYSPKPLHRLLIDCCGLTEFFITHPSKLPKSHPTISDNNFGKFHFRNVDKHVTNTVDIPEEVIEQINLHQDELAPDVRRAYNIMMGTGIRVSETVTLQKGWFEFNATHKIHTLKYIPWKTEKLRLKKGLDEHNTICVADETVVDCIKEQIDSVSALREATGFQEIFLRKHNSRRNNVTILNPSTIIRELNKLIVKHDIRSHGGNLWKFSNHQTRKTVAVLLTENGATTSQIRQQFAYLCDDTVEKIYSEVRDKKMAELNHTFFEKKFRILLGKEGLAQYSEEQRRVLYVEFCLGYREVEFGVCIKPMGEGFCEKRSDTEIICAECNNLCTGSKYRDKWASLFMSQEKVVRSLEAAYLSAEILPEIYQTFREYQAENHKLFLYANKVAKIDEKR